MALSPPSPVHLWKQCKMPMSLPNGTSSFKKEHQPKTANKTKGQKRTLESKNQAEAHQAQDTDVAAPAASEEGADGANGESQADPLAPESQPPREPRSRKIASFKAVVTQMQKDEKTKQAMEKEKKHDSMPTTAFTRSKEGFLQDLTMIYHTRPLRHHYLSCHPFSSISSSGLSDFQFFPGHI